MKILYIGDDGAGATSLHRANALRRIGHEVSVLNPRTAVKWNRYNRFLHFHTGYTLLERRIRDYLLGQLENSNVTYDILWVDIGEYVAPRLLEFFRARTKYMINFHLDDPTGPRDWGRWITFRRALRLYDLCVVVREESEREYPSFGARKVLKVWRTADEVAHRPREITPKIRSYWQSEVAFVGTWMPERGPFMLRLLKLGVPLAIWGDRWQKAPEWKALKSVWRGGSLAGDDYCYAIQCAKVNIGLLSKGNRDLHTTRTAEIPYLGALFCAEQTREHSHVFENGHSAFLWQDADDCARIIQEILPDNELRRNVALAGRKRIIELGLQNEVVTRQIIEVAQRDLVAAMPRQPVAS